MYNFQPLLTRAEVSHSKLLESVLQLLTAFNMHNNYSIVYLYDMQVML